MNRREFRIVLPMTVDEYKTAQLWSIAEASKGETGGEEGIEIVVNEPYEKDSGETGQFTHKIYHLSSKLPRFIILLAPHGATEVHEKSWNHYPYCETTYSNDYMKENFELTIHSVYLPDGGDSENVHKLSEEDWKNTIIAPKIDIATDRGTSDYNSEFDPKLYLSQKTGRGKLSSNWMEELKSKVAAWEKHPDGDKPAMMCAYKLVSCKFLWFGLQKSVESRIMKSERRIFLNFHRQLFCWMNNWYGMTLEEVRKFEEETKGDLDELLHTGVARGMFEK